MNDYIATFYTHHAALVSTRALCKAGLAARMMPVPRTLSSSCGTCVRYQAQEEARHLLHADYEQIVLVTDDGYQVLAENT